MVTIGSIAVTHPELFMGWMEKYGADRMILGADVRHGKISINGWKEDSDEDLALVATLREQHVFTPATALGFMMFVLLYFPCVATIATLRREIGRGWAAFSVVNSIVLAWLVAFLFS